MILEMTTQQKMPMLQLKNFSKEIFQKSLTENQNLTMSSSCQIHSSIKNTLKRFKFKINLKKCTVKPELTATSE
jgi:hypothetical protein